MTQKITAALGGSVKGKTLGILGLAFKANTDDIRESPALAIISNLEAAGASLRVYDPQGMEHGKAYFSGKRIEWCTSTEDCATRTDALVIVTEWNEFRHLDFAKLKSALRQPLLIDLRNLYPPQDVRDAGFKYVSVGRN